jgi:hypothetical protein
MTSVGRHLFDYFQDHRPCLRTDRCAFVLNDCGQHPDGELVGIQ